MLELEFHQDGAASQNYRYRLRFVSAELGQQRIRNKRIRIA